MQAAVWPFVRDQLPPMPASVLEIGCGPRGGFVPLLLAVGYRATGIDPQAPDAPGYHRVEFERYDLPQPVDAVVACTSLHHVADLGKVLDLVAAALVPGGVLVVVEWARERFDEATAAWCFARLRETHDGHDGHDGHETHDGHEGGLHRRRAEWLASGQPWDAYCLAWARAEGLHAGRDILRALDARFDRTHCTCGPYFFPDLDDVSEGDEQAAIDAGQIQATRIQYAGRRG